MAGCAIPTSSAGHAPAGAKADPKLTFEPDHLVGAGHSEVVKKALQTGDARIGNAAQDEQVGEHVDDIDRLEPARYPNGQTFMGKFVNDVEHAEFASIMGALLDEVVRPDVVGALGPQPNA